MTLAEVAIVAGISVIILLPMMALYTRSVQLMYVGDQESTAQRQVSIAMYTIGQDIQKALYFGSINSTINNSYFVCTTYNSDSTGSGTLAVHYYYKPSDGKLYRVEPFTGTLSTGGTAIAKYITGFTCTYRTDTVYHLTLTSSSVASVFVKLSVAVPGSTYTYLTTESSWWSRNIRTL